MDAFSAVLLALVIVIALVVTLAAASVRILREYERAVVFRLGRLLGVKGPGLILLIPFVDRMQRVDLRTVTLTIPPQSVITRDNVPAKVNAVCYFRVVDASRAVVSVEKFLQATTQIAQTTLRSVLGKADLDMLLAEREQLNEALQQIIDEHTDPWGIKVTTVEIKDVEIPVAMQHAMALGAQAERERRAKIIHAEGEFQASQRLRDAADVISGNPASLQLRYLQTLTEIGATQNSTVVFPLPMDLMKPFAEALQEVRSSSRSGETETISSSSPPSLTRPDPDADQVAVVASGRSSAPGPKTRSSPPGNGSNPRRPRAGGKS
jgi:regulator of protease activity HflC (stomatin/prohibitin superfamily)